MEKTLQFYIYVDGIKDTPFPNATHQAILNEYKYDADRMGNAPIISGTLMHPSCLDELWDDNRVYVTFRGEKYFINQKPSSSYSNEDARYKHDVELVSERSILNEVYFYDVVSGDTTSDKYFSNSADVVFYGDINELAKRLNYALSWAKLGYTVVVDSGVTTEQQLVSFQNKFIGEVLNDSYELFKVPYYFVGKTIHLGYTNNVIDTTFKYGADNSLLSIAKNYSSDRVINRATGIGSADNIPYYYPNFDSKGVTQVIYNRDNTTSVEVANKRKYLKVKLNDKFTYQQANSYTLDYINKDNYTILEGFEKDKPSDKYPNEEPDYYIVVDFPFTVDLYRDTTIKLAYDKVWFKGINARLYRNNELWERYNQLGTFYNYRLYEGDYHFTITLEVKLTDGRELFTDEDIPDVLDALQVSITTQISGYQQWVLNDNYNVVKLEDYGLEMKVEPKNGDTITFKQLSYIPPQPNLMPSIYRETLGNSRFYNALNNTYLNPDNNEYYVFPNPYLEGAPKEQIATFDDIKPSIKGMINANGLRIDMFSEFAYDTNDNDEFDEEGNYLHPYFFAKLRKFDGTYGFNLFDHSIDEAEMSISMTSGSCGACEFIIGVDDKTQKNTVQVDENGNLLRDKDGNVRCGREGMPKEYPQDRQNDTQNYEVWIALKKDINTFGVIMPNATSNYKPSSGDTFVILHIDLPDAYIIAAEKKLEQEIIRYIYENNSNKYNLSIAFSRIYLANNTSVANALNENAQVKVEYNTNVYTLYVSSFSYNRSSNDALPEIRVELSQELGIKKASLPQQVAQTKETLTTEIAKASQEVATTKSVVAQTKATAQENNYNLTSKVENLELLVRTQQGDTADLKDSASAWTLDEQTTKARTTSKVLRTKYNVAIDNMLSLNGISDVGATLKDILESIGKWNELWRFDKENNAVYTPINLIVEGTLAMGNLGEGGSGEVATPNITIKFYGSEIPYTPDANGIITLPAYPEGGGGGLSSVTVRVNGYDYNSINGIVTLPNYPSLAGYATESWVNNKGYITASALNGYATQSWVGDNYLGLGGGTINGNLSLNQYLRINAWSGYGRGSANVWYDGNVNRLYWENATDMQLANNVVLHGGNYSSYALPLSGGTIKGTGAGLLTINRTNGNPLIEYQNNGSFVGYIGVNASGSPMFADNNGSYNIIHSGNIGSYNAGSSDVVAKTYGNQSINFAQNESKLRLIKWGGGANSVDNGYPGAYMSGLSVMTDYTGWQMVTYGSIGTPNPYFRSFGDDGRRSEWKQLAFLTDNVASATKLQTARTIWGQSFDGTGDITGAASFTNGRVNIPINGDRITFNGSGYSMGILAMDNGNTYIEAPLTSDSSLAAQTPILIGWRNGVYPFYIAPSGNVLIGTTTDNGVNKLQVNGSLRAKWCQFGSIRINKGSGDYVGSDTIEHATAGGMIYINYYHNGGLNLCNGGGNVLIGSATDNGYKFQIYDSSSNSNAILISTTNGNGEASIFYQALNSGSYWAAGIACGLANQNVWSIYSSNAGKWIFAAKTTGVDVNGNLTVYGGATFGGDVWTEGTMAMRRLNSSSDQRLKNTITSINTESSIDVIKKLKPAGWKWNADDSKSYGFIAQEVLGVVPEMVAEVNNYLHLEYNQLHAFEVGAIQYIDSEVDKLKKDLAIANGRIEILENELKQYRRA